MMYDHGVDSFETIRHWAGRHDIAQEVAEAKFIAEQES